MEKYWPLISFAACAVSILVAWGLGSRAYQKLKDDQVHLAANQARFAEAMAEKWQAHYEESRRLNDALRDLANQMSELIRHDVRLDNYHKRIQRLEDNQVAVGVMSDSVKWIKDNLMNGLRQHK